MRGEAGGEAAQRGEHVRVDQVLQRPLHPHHVVRRGWRRARVVLQRHAHEGAALRSLVAEVAARLLEPSIARFEQRDALAPPQEHALTHPPHARAHVEGAAHEELRLCGAHGVEHPLRVLEVLARAAVTDHRLLVARAAVAVRVPPRRVGRSVLLMPPRLLRPERLQAAVCDAAVVEARDERRRLERSSGVARVGGRDAGLGCRRCSRLDLARPGVRLAQRDGEQVIVAHAALLDLTIARELVASAPHKQAGAANLLLLQPQLVGRRGEDGLGAGWRDERALGMALLRSGVEAH